VSPSFSTTTFPPLLIWTSSRWTAVLAASIDWTNHFAAQPYPSQVWLGDWSVGGQETGPSYLLWGHKILVVSHDSMLNHGMRGTISLFLQINILPPLLAFSHIQSFGIHLSFHFHHLLLRLLFITVVSLFIIHTTFPPLLTPPSIYSNDLKPFQATSAVYSPFPLVPSPHSMAFKI
jgi:hypothetical protein